MNSGLEKCFEALERIKINKPNLLKFKNIPPSKVTPAIISQEAGFDSGYLKKKRPQHQALLSLIESYKHSDSSSTLSFREKIARERRKTESMQSQINKIETKLHEALAREILLLDQIDRMEQELLRFGVKL